jgi:hypothetical protein
MLGIIAQKDTMMTSIQLEKQRFLKVNKATPFIMFHYTDPVMLQMFKREARLMASKKTIDIFEDLSLASVELAHLKSQKRIDVLF